MRAAALLAAAYGITYRPHGLTEQEALAGLVANLQAVRAQMVMDQSTSIAIAMSGKVPDSILDAASETPAEAQRAKVEAWADDGRTRLESLVRRSR